MEDKRRAKAWSRPAWRGLCSWAAAFVSAPSTAPWPGWVSASFIPELAIPLIRQKIERPRSAGNELGRPFGYVEGRPIPGPDLVKRSEVSVRARARSPTSAVPGGLRVASTTDEHRVRG